MSSTGINRFFSPMAYADICLGLHHLLRDLQVGVLKNFPENRQNLSSICHQIGAPKALSHASPPQDGFAVANPGTTPQELDRPGNNLESFRGRQSAGYDGTHAGSES